MQIIRGNTRMLAVLALVLGALAGCQSAQSDSGMGNSKVKIIEPEILIQQATDLPEAARFVTGGISVKYQVQVSNRSGEPITLKRINLQSMGAGAYSLPQTSRNFNVKIAPDRFEIVELWASANISDPTILGANGPVTLRGIAQFDSPVGQFQTTFVQQVHESQGGTGAH